MGRTTACLLRVNLKSHLMKAKTENQNEAVITFAHPRPLGVVAMVLVPGLVFYHAAMILGALAGLVSVALGL